MDERTQWAGAGTHRRRLAEALRSFCAQMVTCDAPDEAFEAAADAVEQFTRALHEEPRRVRRIAASVQEEIRVDGERVHYGDLLYFSPLAGTLNPLAPPMKIVKQDPETMLAFVSFSSLYEGGPGFVHGGYIAAAFDELLGLTQSLTGRAGMTGILNTRYRNPCPLHRELHMEGRVSRFDDRRILTQGRMYDGELLLADAEATFVLVGREEFRKRTSHLKRPPPAS